MKIRWFDAAVCVPKESGTYLTVSGISELSFTSLDWSAKNRAWNVADNSGAREAVCIRVLGGTKRRYATVGDIIVVAVQNVIPSSDMKKGTVSRALIVRTKKEIHRADGSCIRFDDNACVLLSAAGELRGSRIFGPVARELRAVNMKVVSLAPEVL